MLAYGVVFAVAAGLTYLLTPAVWRLAMRRGLVVVPDERRVHVRPTPTLGGGAMLIAFVAAMGVAFLIPSFRPIFEASSEPLGVVIAAVVIAAIGMLDDVREVSAPAKVAGQVLAGSVLGLAGVTIFFFRIPFADFIVLSPDLGFLITVLWVVGMANAVNLIDGLDGLAAGVVALAAGALFVYATRLSDVGLLDPGNMAPLIMAITCGLCVGFLPHNFNPAKIFMGDGGSMLLGLLLAAATISIGGRTADQFSGQTYFFFAPLLIPFIILGVPIVDTGFAIIRRAVRRASLAEADKEHLHHRLMRLGHGPRRSVVILWAWTAVLSGVVLVPTFTNRGNGAVPFLLAALAVLLYTFFHPGIRTPEEPAVQLFDQEAPWTAPAPEGADEAKPRAAEPAAPDTSRGSRPDRGASVAPSPMRSNASAHLPPRRPFP